MVATAGEDDGQKYSVELPEGAEQAEGAWRMKDDAVELTVSISPNTALRSKSYSSVRTSAGTSSGAASSPPARPARRARRAARPAIGSHATSSANAEPDFVAGVCKTFPKGTARDVVYHVKLPSDTKGLEVSVDAATGGNPFVAVLEDPSCGQPANACSDLNGPNACEVLFAPRSGYGFFGTSTFVVVSEVSTTGVSLTTRFRSVGP